MNQSVLLRRSYAAMATEFELLLWGSDATHLQEVAEAACEEIDALERQLSAYLPTSDVCWLNRTAPYRPAQVEPGLFRLLQLAARLHAETEGAFDITVGPLIRCWDFFRRQGTIPPAEELDAARRRVGMWHIHLDPRDCSVSFDREGIEINLGGIGKGYAVQRAIEFIRRYCVHSALVHAGFSSIVAFGNPLDGSGWRVGLRHPRQPDRRLGAVRLSDEALSTSGDYEQFFEVAGNRYSHILDPRTGLPAQGTYSAWAQAPEGGWADALSTAFFVLGVEGTQRYCHTHPEVGAALVPAREEEGEFVCLGKLEIESICPKEPTGLSSPLKPD